MLTAIRCLSAWSHQQYEYKMLMCCVYLARFNWDGVLLSLLTYAQVYVAWFAVC